MKTRIIFMGGLVAVAGFAGSCKRQVIGIENLGNYKDTGTSLKAAISVPIGVAVDYTPTLNDANYVNIVKRDFTGVTFSYQMKHGAIVQSDGSLNFSQADAMAAALNGEQVYGHTLGWHQNQNEGYLESFAGITQAAPVNLLLNGGFELGSGSTFTNWSVFNGAGSFFSGAAPNVTGGSRSLEVINATSNPGAQYKVQLASDLFNTTVGVNYQVTIHIKAVTAGGSMRLSTQNSTGGNAQYEGDQTIGTSFQTITFTFAAKDAQTRICIDIGLIADTYFIDDMAVNQVVVAPSGAQVAAKLYSALNTFITGTVNHFKGTVKAWDVVNEVFADDGTLRNNTNTPKPSSPVHTDWFVWSNYLGASYIDSAFIYAHAADPSADLFLNDYNLENGPPKVDSFVAKAKSLKARGIPITGVGTQLHVAWNTSYPGIDAAFQKLASTGLKVRISELDVKINPVSKTGFLVSPELLAYQADMYHYIIQSYLKNVPQAQQFGITIWGVNDPNSWLYNSGTEFPLLYDKNYARKPAYAGFLQALKGK